MTLTLPFILNFYRITEVQMTEGTPNTTPEDVSTPPETLDWREALPETLKGNEVFKDFDSIGKLAEAYAQSKIVPEVKPEEYALPEGNDEFIKVAIANKLSKDQVGALMTFDKTRVAQLDAKYAQDLKSLKEGEWKESFKENVSLAKKALAHFDKSGEVAKMLEETRAGNNPMVIKFLHAIGSQLGEDSFVKGGAPGVVSRSQADIMYGNSNKE